MVLTDLSTTPVEELPLPQFKEHLRLGTGFAEDSLQDAVLESYLRAAIAAIEVRIGKVLISRTLEWSITRWAESGEQGLPVAPVSELVSVSLSSASGVEDLDLDRFVLIPDAFRPKVQVQGSFPGISSGGSAVIRFRAGYGASWDDVPADLCQSVFLLAGNYYEKRFDTMGAAGLMPFGVMALLEPYRAIRTIGARA